MGAQGGKAWEEIKQSFSRVGYRLYHRVVDSADYGVPQHRERLIVVGVREGEFLFPRPTHGIDSIDRHPHFTAGQAVEGLQLTEEERKTGINGKFGHLIEDIPPGLNYSFYTSEMGHPHPLFAWRSKFSDFMYKADPDMPVRTIKAQGGQYTGPLHWSGRHFAVAEYKRLQTFPDNYAIVGNRQTAIQQIGNSVPPQLARMLALAIRIQLFGMSFPFQLETLPEKATLSFRRNKRTLTAHYRKKAQEAIQQLYTRDERSQPADEHFYITLTDKFKYIMSERQGDYYVKTTWGKQLTIDVTSVKEGNAPDSTVSIKSRKGWTLPVKSVEMHVHSCNWFALTVAWKVLDHLLATHGLKADLIQLNGYYQYESNLECRLTSDIMGHNHILDNILNGQAVGKNLTTAQMATLLAVSEQEVMSVGKWLRHLGYEIRNSHTNPQIEKDTWLIPYKFPTLLPESVQLYKTLE
jgi:DNA (cytosine-5)-methyltransferase 1